MMGRKFRHDIEVFGCNYLIIIIIKIIYINCNWVITWWQWMCINNSTFKTRNHTWQKTNCHNYKDHLFRKITDVASGNYMKNFESKLPSFLLLMQLLHVFATVGSTQC
jgi:hypothetical protein